MKCRGGGEEGTVQLYVFQMHPYVLYPIGAAGSGWGCLYIRKSEFFILFWLQANFGGLKISVLLLLFDDVLTLKA